MVVGGAMKEGVNVCSGNQRHEKGLTCAIKASQGQSAPPNTVEAPIYNTQQTEYAKRGQCMLERELGQTILVLCARSSARALASLSIHRSIVGFRGSQLYPGLYPGLR